MKRKSLGKRVGYWLDYMMSKGTIAMSLLLFIATSVIVIIIGIIAYFVSDDGNVLYQFWNSLMYTLDAGNLAGVPTDNTVYLLLMFLATLCGLFLTSILIGVITTGVEAKLSDLRKGISAVQDKGHTVIVGFDSNVYDILRELIEANANKKEATVVVLGEQSKEEIEDGVFSHIPDSKNVRIICRSGNLHEHYAMERCSVETSKSVIINIYDDAEVIKILLALAAYLKGKDLTNPELRFIATIQDKQYVDAANIAGEGRAAIIFTKDTIARIIANTCRQHGLSQVFSELFNYIGNEIYFERVAGLEGKTFKEAMMSFSNAIVLGLYSDDQTLLNPPQDTVIGKNDQVILLEEDDGVYNYHLPKDVDESKICDSIDSFAETSNSLVIVGSNEKLPIILAEYEKYVAEGTRVIIIDDDFEETKLGIYNNLEITLCKEAVTEELLVRVLDEDFNNLLLLNDDSQDAETSDSKTLLSLIFLRDIADKQEKHFAITTEMRKLDNQKLATRARVDDFVIGSNFTSLMMSQISENPKIITLIEELLDTHGCELYMKGVADYVTVGVPVDSYTLTESAARKGEIYLGYKKYNGAVNSVIINPRKNDAIVFGENDMIVVLAEN